MNRMPSKGIRKVFGRAQPAVDIKRDFYTMATVDGNEAEIVLYGQIVQDRPVDWWTGEPVEGNYIVLSEFLQDLEQISKADKLVVRINSIGGDAYAAIPIHNRLRELKAHKTVIVDGVAMSGGSLIMCAGDTIKVNASSLIMIHKCYVSLWGGFNSSELRKLADENDAVDQAQVAIYKRKTGMEEEAILSMMADETYMTGSEAVEKGFADELMEGDAPDIAASADSSTIFVDGRAFHFNNPLSNLPESIKTVQSGPEPVKTNNPAKTGDEEGGKIMAKNFKELQAENPELAKLVLDEARAMVVEEAGSETETAVDAERQRLAEIDEIAAQFDDETVREAKYGEKRCTAQEMAFEAAKRAAKQGKEFLDDVKGDVKASGANDVPAVAAGEKEKTALTPAERLAQGRADAQKMTAKEDK